MAVIIRKPAFIGIMTACAEVYKKESFGLLLGRKRKNDYIIKYAVDYQSAKRTYEFVKVGTYRENIINRTLKAISKQRVMGDFHSHPDSPSRLSKVDKEELKKSGLISLLIVLRKSKKKERWVCKEDLSLSGSIGNLFHVKIFAYKYDKKKNKVVKIKMCSPFTKKL